MLTDSVLVITSGWLISEAAAVWFGLCLLMVIVIMVVKAFLFVRLYQ